MGFDCLWTDEHEKAILQLDDDLSLRRGILMKLFNLKTSVASFSLIVLVATQSKAFTLTYDGRNKGYANPEITIMINQSSCPAGIDLAKIVSDAVEVWNRVSWSKLKLTVGGDTTATTSTFPPTAYCDATITGSTLGLGGSSMNSNFVLVGGSLRLNTNVGTAGYVLNQSYDRVVVVAAHEIGHLLGIGHSPDSYALMNYTIGSKTSLNLSQDDLDAVVYLYGRDELSGDQMLGGCGTVAAALGGGKFGSGSSSAMVFTLLLLMPLLVLFWRRHRSAYAYIRALS